MTYVMEIETEKDMTMDVVFNRNGKHDATVKMKKGMRLEVVEGGDSYEVCLWDADGNPIV